ncbi:MAG: hypothetical protein LBP76_14260 [Treponema sp.]|nr:hypothetical protein [Treponema sp.]
MKQGCKTAESAGLWYGTGKVLFPVVAVFLFSGCVSRFNVITGMSELLDDRGVYPSIEVDIAALTDKEVDEIKSLGVEGYFSPGNTIRRRIEPFTVFFSNEDTTPATLLFDDIPWKTWMRKKPKTLFIIASLPPAEEEADERMLFLPMGRTVLGVRTKYIRIESNKIVEVYERPLDPRVQGASKEE